MTEIYLLVLAAIPVEVGQKPIWSPLKYLSIISKGKCHNFYQQTARVLLSIQCRSIVCDVGPYNAEIFLFKPWRPKGFFIINILVSSFRLIQVHMVWFYDRDHYTFLILSVRGSTLDARIGRLFWRLKSVPVLKVLNQNWLNVFPRWFYVYGPTPFTSWQFYVLKSKFRTNYLLILVWSFECGGHIILFCCRQDNSKTYFAVLQSRY